VRASGRKAGDVSGRDLQAELSLAKTRHASLRVDVRFGNRAARLALKEAAKTVRELEKLVAAGEASDGT